MNWKYGLTEQERAFGTVVAWKEGKGKAIVTNFKQEAEITIRDEEVMFPCGPYFIPTSDVGKSIQIGDVLECLLMETEEGLMGLGARKVNEIDFPADWSYTSNGNAVEPPRLIGVVQHWNFERSFGFIKSDHVRTNLFFHRREVLVPYEFLNDPPKAVKHELHPGNLVTFDAVNTPRGMRALAIRKFTKMEAS